MPTLNPGDRVQLSRNFLRSIGAVASGLDLGHAEGTVVAVIDDPRIPRARVRWQGETETKSVLLRNLKLKSKPEVE